MYTKDNLLFISQLELLYKSAMHTLREQNIQVNEKHEQLFDAIPDHDSIDLLDSIEILHDLILQHENYEDYGEIEED